MRLLRDIRSVVRRCHLFLRMGRHGPHHRTSLPLKNDTSCAETAGFLCPAAGSITDGMKHPSCAVPGGREHALEGKIALPLVTKCGAPRQCRDAREAEAWRWTLPTMRGDRFLPGQRGGFRRVVRKTPARRRSSTISAAAGIRAFGPGTGGGAAWRAPRGHQRP